MKKIYMIILMVFVSVGLAAQVNWAKHDQPVLPQGGAGSWDESLLCPSVLKLGDTYHMWYTGINASQSMKIGYATSMDGIIWDKYEDNPVLGPGPAGSFDENRTYLPIVVYDDSIFHMYYVGAKNDENEYLFYATSEDGTTWTKHEAPEFQQENGDPYGGHVNRGDVYYDGEVFHMWAGMTSRGLYDVGYATSADGAIWTVVDPTVIYAPLSGEWDDPRIQVATVFEMGDMYHMWYSGGDLFSWDIGYMHSPDGLNWTKHEANPVLTRGEPGTWDAAFVAFPTIMYDPSDFILKMWYSGSSESVGGIGYAEQSFVSGLPGFELPSDSKDGDLVLYPNPARTYFIVETGKEEPGSVEILSMNGQVLYTETLKGGTRPIDVSGIPRGLYIVKVTIKSEFLTRKLVIE